MRPKKSSSKYHIGERITTLDELYKQEFIYIGGRIYHKGWFRHWQFKMAYEFLYNTRGIFQVIRERE